MTDLAHHFFSRCLEGNVVPYVVTKKTVFKWQEGFWTIMKSVFDEHYKYAPHLSCLLLMLSMSVQCIILLSLLTFPITPFLPSSLIMICYDISSYHITSHHITSHHITSHHTSSYHATPHHITPFINIIIIRAKYMEAKLIPDGNLQHLISDAATMQIIRWTKGGFGM